MPLPSQSGPPPFLPALVVVVAGWVLACGPQRMTTQAAPSIWTHMRVFILRDSAQLAGLSAALDAAGVAIEPDSAKRRARSQYGATLRDAAGSATYRVLP